MKHFRYLGYVLKHKWFVFIECCRRREVWLGIIHDISKFRWSEWFAYVHYFYGEKKEDTTEFDVAWLHHQHRNKHHWQYWLQVNRKGEVVPLEIPLKYTEEMIADWNGAARAKGQGGTYTPEWYTRNKDTIILAPTTLRWVENAVKRLEEKKACTG